MISLEYDSMRTFLPLMAEASWAQLVYCSGFKFNSAVPSEKKYSSFASHEVPQSWCLTLASVANHPQERMLVCHWKYSPSRSSNVIVFEPGLNTPRITKVCEKIVCASIIPPCTDVARHSLTSGNYYYLLYSNLIMFKNAIKDFVFCIIIIFFNFITDYQGCRLTFIGGSQFGPQVTFSRGRYLSKVAKI